MLLQAPRPAECGHRPQRRGLGCAEPVLFSGEMQPGLGRAAGLAGLVWDMGHRRDGDSTVCRDAGSRDLTSHVATLQCCMLQCATIRLLQEAVRVDTAVVALVASGVG